MKQLVKQSRRRRTGQAVFGFGIAFVWLGLMISGKVQAQTTAPSTRPTRLQQMEAAVRKFEAADREKMPALGQIEFYGSSTIAFWDVKKWFPDLPVINRGFGGSTMADAAHFAKRIVTPYQPKLVVLYEGDNDIADGVTPKLVIEALERLEADVHRDAPKAHIMVLSLKPSLLRWKMVESMRETNRLIKQFTERHENMSYVEMEPLMLNEKGEPRRELFKADGLHMNEEGYKLWSEKLRPLLTAYESSH